MAHYESTLPLMRKAGVEVDDAVPSLAQYIENGAQIVREYERDWGIRFHRYRQSCSLTPRVWDGASSRGKVSSEPSSSGIRRLLNYLRRLVRQGRDRPQARTRGGERAAIR
jgi:hypothetical protein